MIVWGGRVALLTDAESADLGTRLRVAASVAVGLALLAAAWRARRWPYRWPHRVFLANVVVAAGVWIPSLARVLPGDHALGFKVVHALLAAGSLGLAVTLVVAARRVQSITSMPIATNSIAR